MQTDSNETCFHFSWEHFASCCKACQNSKLNAYLGNAFSAYRLLCMLAILLFLCCQHQRFSKRWKVRIWRTGLISICSLSSYHSNKFFLRKLTADENDTSFWTRSLLNYVLSGSAASFVGFDVGFSHPLQPKCSPMNAQVSVVAHFAFETIMLEQTNIIKKSFSTH